MFEKQSFEDRVESIKNGRCSCFPDNPEIPNCLNKCEHRKFVVDKMEGEANAENNSDEE